jgi:hypothetical protein
MIDLREDEANAFDRICVNPELSSNKIDESDVQSEKHDEERT